MKKLMFLLIAVAMTTLVFFSSRQYHKESAAANKAVEFEWEGLERDIPEDGDRMINISREGNTVYLNPADE